MGDVTDLSNFMGAVIDDRAFAKHAEGDRARPRTPTTSPCVAGGQADDSDGYFVRPTIVARTDPTDEMFTTEYFGPILAVHVYDDADFETVLAQMESVAPYALTGAVFAQDRRGDRLGAAGAALRGRQLLRQRQADRRRRRPAAVRRRPRLRHQRQGRRQRSTCCAGPRRGRSRRRSSRRRTTGTRTWTPVTLLGPVPDLFHMGQLHPFEQALTLLLAFGPFVLLGVVVWRPAQEHDDWHDD